MRVLITFLLLVYACTSFQVALASDAVPLNPKEDRTFLPDVSAFKRWPILHDGRLKPLDSFARASLKTMSGREYVEYAGGKLTASQWLVQMVFRPWDASALEVFYVPNPDVIKALGIETAYKKRWSFDELILPMQSSLEMLKQLQEQEKREERLSKSQQGLLDLYYKSLAYLEISKSLSLFVPKFSVSDTGNYNKLQLDSYGIQRGERFSYLDMLKIREAYLQEVAPLVSEERTQLGQWSAEELELLELGETLRRVDLEKQTSILSIIPWQLSKDDGEWISPWRVMEDAKGTPENKRLMNIVDRMVSISSAGDLKKWEDSAQAFFEALLKREALTGKQQKIFEMEIFMNSFELFFVSLCFYIAAFLCILVFVLFGIKIFSYLSFGSLIAGGAIHLGGLVLRMLIMGRPPVTTLYESIIFVGLICVIFAVVLELRHKDGQSLLLGAFLGSVLQFVGLRYSASGDTLGMLAAVLNTNFWLSTHVVTITIGYGACLLCGAVAHVAAFNAFIKKDTGEGLHQAVKTLTVCALVSLFFTMFGTILGGIWADQSWGRFWGWDPKENGALFIVLWLSFLLHARLAGLIKHPGFIVCCMLTCPIVVLAWFGVNLLGVGLHSYGFVSNIVDALVLYYGLQFLAIFVLSFLMFRAVRVQEGS